MLEKFNEYFEKLEESSHIAAFLDPRYKKYCFPEMTDHEIQSSIRKKLEQNNKVEFQPYQRKKYQVF